MHAEWIPQLAPSGKTFYYNKYTGEKTWIVPVSNQYQYQPVQQTQQVYNHSENQKNQEAKLKSLKRKINHNNELLDDSTSQLQFLIEDNRDRIDEAEDHLIEMNDTLLELHQIIKESRAAKLKEKKEKLKLAIDRQRKLKEDKARFNALVKINCKEKVLDLSKKSLKIISDDAIDDLNEIEILVLQGNPLGENISNNLWSLKFLIDLNLCDCELKELPTAIGNLINIEILDVRNNSFKTLPDSLYNLKKIQELYGKFLNAINRKLNFVVIIIAHITFLPTVTNNEISMVSVKLGENLLNLEHLWLDGNHLNSIPSNFKYLRKLVSLYLNNNKLTSLPNIFDVILQSTDADLCIHNNPGIANYPTSIKNVVGFKNCSQRAFEEMIQ